MSLTPEPAGVAQGAFFPAAKARRAAPRGHAHGVILGAGRGVQRLLTLVLWANVTEYEQARVEVETSPRPPGQARPAGRDKGGCVTPVPADGTKTADGEHYVVTTDEQRQGRAGWSPRPAGAQSPPTSGDPARFGCTGGGLGGWYDRSIM